MGSHVALFRYWNKEQISGSVEISRLARNRAWNYDSGKTGQNVCVPPPPPRPHKLVPYAYMGGGGGQDLQMYRQKKKIHVHVKYMRERENRARSQSTCYICIYI